MNLNLMKPTADPRWNSFDDRAWMCATWGLFFVWTLGGIALAWWVWNSTVVDVFHLRPITFWETGKLLLIVSALKTFPALRYKIGNRPVADR